MTKSDRRRAKFGGWYSPEAQRRMSELRRAKNAARTECKRGHKFAEHARVRPSTGARVCRLCVAARKREKRQEQGLVPAGASTRSIGAMKAWATKRQRYGDAGVSADARARLAAATKGRPRKTTCRQGHEFSPANTRHYTHPNGTRRRICRACLSIRKRGRPEWIEVDGVRICLGARDRFYLATMRRLRQQLVDAHPDNPNTRGTAAKFRAVKKVIDRFQATEAEGYAAIGYRPPSLKRRAVTQSAAA